MRQRTLATAASIGLLACWIAGCRGARHAVPTVALHACPCPRCNVLLISIDTLRADHLRVYGYARETSPNIDRFAREAVLFEQSINTGGGTLAVHASMLTSLPPTVHGVWADSGRVLDPRRVTLAKQLQAAGYRTAAITGGGYVSAVFGLQQGFDQFDDRGGGLPIELPKVYDWLDSKRAGRSFLFLHTYDVHSAAYRLPYDHGDAWNRRFAGAPPPGYDGCRRGKCASQLLLSVNRAIEAQKLRAADAFSPAEVAYMEGLYDGGIAYADAQLGQLFAWLQARGIWDQTVIVLTADHGEEFAEHGLFLHEQNHEEVARVPLLIRFPHGQFGGRRIAKLVSTLEVMPTILDALGITANPEVMGRSVLPLIEGDAGREVRRWVYMAGALEKLRTPAWSLFADGRGPVQLFDLRRDPRETTDVLAANRATGASLYVDYAQARRRELRLRHDLLLSRPNAKAHLARGDRERLRALGYLD
jgi:arylsulfatase A-like enzyme